MLRRDTWPELFRLGWPISATLLVRITMRTVDLLVIGAVVGAAGVAALGIGDAIARVVLFTALGLGAGTIATVSQHLGAGDAEGAAVAVTHSSLLAFGLGIPFAIIGWLIAPPAYRILGAAPDVVDLGIEYLRIVLLSAPARMLAIVLTRAFQGAGDSRTPLVIRGAGTLLNIALTVILAPGLLGLPQLGVRGAAIATATGNVASALLLTAALARGWRGLRFSRAPLGDLAPARRILRIAWPQIVERNLYGLGALPLNAITLQFGTAANAGLQVGQRVMLYGLLPSRGAATAASSLAGNRLGGDRADHADRYIRGGLSLAAVVAFPVAVLLLIVAQPIATLFVSEPDALAAATGWVRVYAGATLLRSLYGVYRGAFQAAGMNRPPLIASAVGIVGFTIGASWLLGLGLGLGLAGVFAGVLLDPVVRTAMLWRWFERGEWQQRLVARPTPEIEAPAGAP